jgi:hypothetical protein
MLTLWFRFCRLAVDEYGKGDESRLRARGTDQDDAGQPSRFIRSCLDETLLCRHRWRDGSALLVANKPIRSLQPSTSFSFPLPETTWQHEPSLIEKATPRGLMSSSSAESIRPALASVDDWIAAEAIRSSFDHNFDAALDRMIGGALGTSDAHFIRTPEPGVSRRGCWRSTGLIVPTRRAEGLLLRDADPLPTRTGRTRPSVPYSPLSPQSVADIDVIAFLRSTTYTRGAPRSAAWRGMVQRITLGESPLADPLPLDGRASGRPSAPECGSSSREEEWSE